MKKLTLKFDIGEMVYVISTSTDPIKTTSISEDEVIGYEIMKGHVDVKFKRIGILNQERCFGTLREACEYISPSPVETNFNKVTKIKK